MKHLRSDEGETQGNILPGEEAQQLLGENNVIKSLVVLGNKFADESEVAEMICTALGMVH